MIEKKRAQAAFFAIVFCAAALIVMAACATGSSNTGNKSVTANPLPDSLFPANPAEWAELRVSNGAFVQSMDGHTLNWVHGSKDYVPAGKHTIVAGNMGHAETVTLSAEFLPGKCYMISYQAEGIDNEVDYYRGVEITTYRGNISLSEYGASDFTIPGRNDSILEFTLDGSYTFLYVDDQPHKLSAYAVDAAEKVRLVLPAGRHKISSLASVGDIEIDLPPNRRLSFTVSTAKANISKTRDEPLNYLGRWKFDVYGDGSVVFILLFSPDGEGYIEIYENNVKLNETGGFTYSAADSDLTVNVEDGISHTMRWQTTPDSNVLAMDNFWGQGIPLTGTRF